MKEIQYKVAALPQNVVCFATIGFEPGIKLTAVETPDRIMMRSTCIINFRKKKKKKFKHGPWSKQKHWTQSQALCTSASMLGSSLHTSTSTSYNHMKWLWHTYMIDNLKHCQWIWKNLATDSQQHSLRCKKPRGVLLNFQYHFSKIWQFGRKMTKI